MLVSLQNSLEERAACGEHDIVSLQQLVIFTSQGQVVVKVQIARMLILPLPLKGLDHVLLVFVPFHMVLHIAWI